MKRILCLLAVLLMCVGLVCPAYAAESDFVPSVSRPEKPAVKDVILAIKDQIESGEYVDGCVVITTVKEATEKTTDIFQEERDLLIDVYEQLADGTMVLPLGKDYVILDVLDVNFRASTCVEPKHTHEPELEKEDTILVLDFDLGVEADAEVLVMVYVDEEWKTVETVINNGDGTITCELPSVGPVAFCVAAPEEEAPVEEVPEQTAAATQPAPTAPQTEPAAQEDNSMLWLLLLLISFLLFLLLIFLRQKRKQKEKNP